MADPVAKAKSERVKDEQVVEVVRPLAGKRIVVTRARSQASSLIQRIEGESIKNCVVPRQDQAEGMLEALSRQMMRGKRVLIPRAAKARDILPETLRRWGAAVDVIEVYRTGLPVADSSAFKSLLQAGGADMITFTSSSTVVNFVQLFQDRKSVV